MQLNKFIRQKGKDEPEIDIKSDLEEVFRGFEWKVKGILDEDGKLYPIPKIPQVVSGIFELLGKERVKALAERKYECKIVEGGAREYPDLTLTGGKLGEKMIAIEIKTARRDESNPNKSSRMSLGSCAGYFLRPDKKMAGCRFPYGTFSEHWIVGCIYTWNEKADSLHMVSDIEIVVHPKWKIASRSTATGDTAAMGSINTITDLKAGKGEFESERKFEEYWRERGRRYKR